MRLREAKSAVLAALPILFVLEAAVGRQRATNAIYNRPSASSVTRIGQLGGLYTRSRITPSGNASGGRANVSPISGGFGSRSTFPRSRFGGTALPALPRLGTARVSLGESYSSLATSGQVGAYGLQLTSGMINAISVNKPPPPYIFSAPPGGHAMYAPPQKGDAFGRYFGLKPAESEPEASASRRSLIAAMKAGLSSRTEELKARALAAFKEERYDEALAMFSGLRRMDRVSHVPSLLAFHAALMLKRHELASSHFRSVLERHPEIFIEDASISEYFSDPATLEDQLHELVRIEDDASPIDLAIKSYCAWRLRDKIGAKASIDRALEASSEKFDERYIKRFSQAIEPALN